MDKMLELFGWVMANYQIYIGSIVGVCTALIALSLLIPGEQPEKFLTAVVDFLGKFSRKPEIK